MNLAESFKIAIKCIRANWLRSLLTMLGIIIGISSVIMIVGVGTGARDYIVSLIEEMGSNAVLLSVDRTKAMDDDYITYDDVNSIKEKVNGVEWCAPISMGIARATLDSNEQSAIAMLMGSSADMVYAMKTGCNYGRFFTEEEFNAAAPVVLIETSSAEAAFGYQDVVGEYITIRSSGSTKKLKVIGVADISSVMSAGGESMNMMGMMGVGDDTMISLMMPCSTLADITGNAESLAMVFLVASDEANNEAIGNAAVNYLKAAHGNYSRDVYYAEDMANYIAIVDVVMSVLTTFIASIGAISLLVGGIGVMNIMLVSVTERTREIGIRKSLGAKTGVITLQFLTESIILCLIGGAIGLLIGLAGAYGTCALMKIEPKVQLWIILLALLFSSSVGLFFGIYPARKAAMMSPIDALRRD